MAASKCHDKIIPSAATSVPASIPAAAASADLTATAV
jgi:hypothetical protein